MPMLFAPLIAYGVSTLAVEVGVSVLTSQIIGGVVAAGLSSVFSSGQGSQTQQSFASTEAGATVNTVSTVDPIPVVYGTRRKGGTRVFTKASGANNEALHVVIVLSEGEISAVREVYLNDLPIGLNLANGQATNAPWKKSNTEVYAAILGIHFGTDTQAVDAELTARLPADWDATHTLSGCAYIYAYLTFSSAVYPSGIPTITADIDGKVLYDPRIPGSPTVRTFSRNPPVCIRDYLTNTRYGRGVPESSIDDATFIAAANVSDELIAVPVEGSPSFVMQPRYTCDGIIDTSRSTLDNMRDLLTSCRGMLVFSGGKYKLIIDKAETPTTFAFSEDNIVGGWNINGRSKRTMFNRVTGKFFDADANWQPNLAIIDNTVDRASDNGLVLETELSLPFTSNIYRANQLAQIHQKQSRFGVTCQFRATIAAIQCEVGDVVPITHSTPGWVAKPFRITRMELLSSDEIQITAQEYQSAAYVLDPFTLTPIVPPTGLPDPFADMDIADLALSSGTADLFIGGDGTVHSRIHATWTALANIFVQDGGHIEVQYAAAAGSPQDWLSMPNAAGAAADAYIVPVEDGAVYDVRVRAVNVAGVPGDWAYAYGHTVAGKSALPSDVTGFSALQQSATVIFSCDAVPDSDLDLVEIRLGDAGSTSWADASPLTNILRGHTATSAAAPPGSWVMFAKAKDTSGNYSANAASQALVVTADGYTTISSTEYAPAWNGGIVNLVEHYTGVLVPKSQSIAASLGWEVFDQFVPDAFADGYFTAPVIDKGIDAPARIFANIVSTLGPGESGSANPGLQIDSRLAAGSFDGFEDWTIGTANFRYLQGRIHVDTTLGKPRISGFDLMVDAASRDESGVLTVGVGGSGAVNFTTMFHNAPILQVTPVGAGDVSASYSALTTSGFTGYYKSAGIAGAGDISWQATGV